MKRLLVLISCAVVIGLTIGVYAQLPEHEPTGTAPPLSAVYELIQNSRAMKATYLLNRYTGQSWLLVQSTKRLAWQKIPKQAHEKDVVPKDWSRPAYQVSVSGFSAKGTYMINVLTGATWNLLKDPEKGVFWGRMSAPQ